MKPGCSLLFTPSFSWRLQALRAAQFRKEQFYEHSASELSQNLRKELLLWLRTQNAKKRLAWLDRPIVVTFIGGLVLALIAHLWDRNEKTRESELTYRRAVASAQEAVLKDFGTTFMNNLQILNSWFTHVVWIAQEKMKPQSLERDKNINKWEQEIGQLEDRYSTVIPLDPTLVRVRAIYTCPSVKQSASDMNLAFDNFIDTFQSFNQNINTGQLPAPAAIAATDQSRIKARDNLEALEDKLLERMAGEIVARTNPDFVCPP
jgi:hypothetical protein